MVYFLPMLIAISNQVRCYTMNKPKISVVLPTYNGARWLSESIQSVIDQTEKDWELIIVNDCSQDNSLEIAEKYAQTDPRIRVLSNSTNKKLPATLNVGFSKASGDYFTWTSDDNRYKSNALEVMSAYLDNHPETDLVSARMDYISESGEVKGTSDIDRNAVDLSYVCNIGAAFLYRRTIADKIGPYDENTFCAEDYDYWCRIALTGKVDYIDDNIYEYRDNSQSLTALKAQQVRVKRLEIQNKYKQQFVEKFQLGWWQREKLNYLIDPSAFRYSFLMLWLRKKLVSFSLGGLLFWNPMLHRRIRKITRIKL